MDRLTQPLTRLAFVPLLALLACDGGEPGGSSSRSRTADDLRNQLLVVSPNPPQIAVSDATELDRAARIGANARLERLSKQNGTRRVRADSLAWLTGSVEGRAFLSSSAPRAIARGNPARSCPATGLSTGAQTRAAAMRSALEQCLGALGSDYPGCGCQLIAIDNALTVPRTEVAYATGISARLIAPALGIDAVLVAEDEPDGTTLLRDLRGPVARLVRSGADGVTLSLIGTEQSTAGTRRALGYRRGRLAERIRLSDGGLLLIGLSPAEIAAAVR